jgi:hypothetical protein
MKANLSKTLEYDLKAVPTELYTFVNENIELSNQNQTVLLWYLINNAVPSQSKSIPLNFRRLRSFNGGKQTSITKFLYDFRETMAANGITFTFTNAVNKQKCREVKKFECSHLFNTIIQIKCKKHSQFTRLSTGEILDSKSYTQLEHERRKLYHKEYNVNQLHPDLLSLKKLQNHLNNLPANTFQRLFNKNSSQALTYINSIPDKESRTSALITFRQIELSPKPLYNNFEETGTCRLYTSSSFANIKREVRKIFFQTFVEVDLVCAHLSIIACMLDCKKLQEHLQTPNQKWDIFLPQHDNIIIHELKPVVKEAVYSIVYGKAKPFVRKSLIAQYSEYQNKAFSKPINNEWAKNEADKLLNSAIISELLSKIRSFLEAIRKKAFLDAFGRAYKANNSEQARSFLSFILHSFEFKLLLPIFEDLIRRKRQNIVLYQFDGFTVKLNKRSELKGFSNRISGILNTHKDKIFQESSFKPNSSMNVSIECNAL